MDFAFSDEQEEFRQTLRRFLSEKSASTDVRRLMETPEGYDRAVWKQMAEELGLPGIHLPEEYGGQGFGFLELGIVCEEMGRVLLCAPYFSTACLAANAILNAGNDAQKAQLLPRIASGDAIATLAWLDDADHWDVTGVQMEVTPEGDQAQLHGSKRWVVDGHVADLIVVAARTPGSQGEQGISLLVVEADAAGLRAHPRETLDATRKFAELEFENVRAELLGAAGESGAALTRTLDQAAVCLAAESAGGAERCLEMAVEYAKQRYQFGRAIGSFQAIQHKCVDMLLEVESAKSLAYWAAWAASQDDPDQTTAASLAKSLCSESYRACAAENIQVHGGMGYTWEADPQLYFKRAKGSELLLGDPRSHRRRIASQLGL